MGFFDKLKSGLSKTKESFDSKINNVFSNFRKVDEEFLEELEEVLIMSDFGMDTSVKIVDNLRKRIKRENLKDEEAVKQALREEIQAIFDDVDNSLKLDTKPSIILVVGVNGVGKTTSIGKIANRLRKEGKKVVIAAADTFRAAAVEQLEVWAKRSGAEIVKRAEGSDPASVVYDAIRITKETESDVLIVDTAGRLHNKKYLMDELHKIKKVITKEMGDLSQEVLLVIDSTTGQNAINQVKAFKEETDVTGLILTKLDGNTKGGVALSVRHLTNVPIKFVGDSEKMDGLSSFDPKRMADRILDMGDILSIAEKVEESIDIDEAETLARKMKKGKYDLEDFLTNLKQIKKMGPLENLMKLIPGARKMGLGDITVDPKDMAHLEAIILSMTPYERRHPEILKFSRKKRIASGSGRNVEEINRLLKQFEQMKTMMKQMSNGNMKLPF